MTQLDFWRQTDLLSQEELNRYPFTVIGAGGIGSQVVRVLAQAGVRDLTVYDPDIVEPHNPASQFYRITTDCGRPKVEALREIIAAFTGLEIDARPCKFPDSRKPAGVVISGLDTMSERGKIWTGSIMYQPGVYRYIDGRMGAQMGRIYTLDPNDPDQIAAYEARLYTDGEAAELPCTGRASGWNTSVLAGLIGSQVQKLVMKGGAPFEIIFDLATLSLLCPKEA